MFKRKCLTTFTIATGTIVFATTLFAADTASNAPAPAKYQLVADMEHPAAPTAPSAPAGFFASSEAENQQNKPEQASAKQTEQAQSATAKTAELMPPSGLFQENILAEKPAAPQQPILADHADGKAAAKDTADAAPTQPVPVAPKVVSMDIAPQVEKSSPEKAPEAAATAPNTKYATPIQANAPTAPTIEAPAKPEAPQSVEKPTEMVAPKNTSSASAGTGSSTSSSSMTMPSMNMSMPSMNMNMPNTSMGNTSSMNTSAHTAPVAVEAKPVAAPAAQPTTEQ